MQPSSWNDENQHWVPQFLLKGFGTKSWAGHVYELNVATRRIRQRGIEEVASTQGLLPDNDDILLKQIERRASAAIGCLRKGHIDVSPKARKVLDELVFALLVNDPYGGLSKEAVREEVVETYSAELVSAVSRWGGSVAPELVKDYLNQGINQDYLNMLLGDPSASLVVDCLRKMGLRFHRAMDGEALAIGDSPVLVVRRSYDGTVRLDNPGTQIILPIHSRGLIAYTWDVPTNILTRGPELDRKQVRSLNQDCFHLSTSRNIYARDIETLERAQQVQLQWTEREHVTRLYDGWVAMHQSMEAGKVTQRNEDMIRKHSQELWAYLLVQKARAGNRDAG